MDSNSLLLALDIGNTASKLSVFSGESLVDTMVCHGEMAAENAHAFISAHPGVAGVACCRTGADSEGLVALTQEMLNVPFLDLGAMTPVPLQVDYDRAVLGPDRLAAAVGVAAPGKASLIADIGTAVTIDLVRDNRYAGGNISPGIRLRLESLHRFTSRLPLVGEEGPAPLFGHNTAEAIRAGVLRGLAYEVAESFRLARELEPAAALVLSGGDAPLISRYLTILNIPHRIDCEAVGRGLVRIFKYNNHDSL